MDIKKKADYLARKYQTRNPFEILRGLNAILVFVPLVGTRAFYQYFQRNNIIYINENLSQHEQIFECAHEMGHMILHKKANAIFMDTMDAIMPPITVSPITDAALVARFIRPPETNVSIESAPSL